MGAPTRLRGTAGTPTGYPGGMSDELEFYFDPICPFCWVTSRWVVEVGRLRELAVHWRPLPLAMLNEGISYEERRKVSESYPDSHLRGLEMQLGANVAFDESIQYRLMTRIRAPSAPV